MTALSQHDENQRRINREEIEFLTEIKGVQLRLGYLIYKQGANDCHVPVLPDDMAWELGIQPDSDTARFIAVVKEYIQGKQPCS